MSARSLLLSDLPIGIAPRADLQAAANPAQPLGRIGSANRAADRALLPTFRLIRYDRTPRCVEQLLLNHRLFVRSRFSFHQLNTTVACLRIMRRSNTRRRSSGPVQAHDVSRIERRRAPRALLTGLHPSYLSRSDDNAFHRVRANGAVHKSFALKLWQRRMRLRTVRNVHFSSYSTDKTQAMGQRIENSSCGEF